MRTYKETLGIIKRAAMGYAANNNKNNYSQPAIDTYNGMAMQQALNQQKSVNNNNQNMWAGMLAAIPLFMGMGGFFNQKKQQIQQKNQQQNQTQQQTQPQYTTKPSPQQKPDIRQFSSPVRVPSYIPKGSQAYKNNLRRQMQTAKQQGLSAPYSKTQ